MAGLKDGIFVEKLGSFLQKKLEEAHQTNNKSLIHIIESQYLIDSREGDNTPENNRRHYEAETFPLFEGKPLKGLPDDEDLAIYEMLPSGDFILETPGVEPSQVTNGSIISKHPL